MSVEQMRESILKAYSTDSWKAKVKKMEESQVIAIYYKFLREGRIKY